VLGELSGAIAHELNQPLTAILSNAQAALHLLAQRSPDLEEIRDALGDIVHEDNRAGEVIKRIRGFLKKGESKTEPVDINDLVNATVALLHSELVSRRIDVDLDLMQNAPRLVGDPIQLQQVILNIVMNAMDAMTATPAGRRRIAIRTAIDQTGCIAVSIRDRGTGIKPVDQGRLFEPFYTTKSQGLGLGLALCSSIVGAHGGKLTLANHQDGGAVAAFALPAEEYLVAAQ
jgi:C4-dicarboxylate-specific signal transduction histidine kinase